MNRLPPPGQEVIADLLESATIEGLWGLARREHEPAPDGVPDPLVDDDRWLCVPLPDGGWVAWRTADGAPLAHTRYAGGQVWHRSGSGTVRPIGPDRLLELLTTIDRSPALDQLPLVLTELRTAVVHAHVVRAGRDRITEPIPEPGGPHGPGGVLLGGELIAATRGRPFHPTARAVSGWSDRDVARYGPTAPEPVELDWVAVRSDHLRRGPGPGSSDLVSQTLSGEDADRIHTRLVDRTDGTFQALPVHPYDLEHVLPDAFAHELATGVVVPLGRAGRGYPTASLRTLALPGDAIRHLKLPLGVATLGAARLLPPRHLDNGDRACRVVAAVLAADTALARRVAMADEGDWAGFALPDGSDEFQDRPGRLAAQVRHFPDVSDGLPLPLAALAAHEWDLLGPLLGVTDTDSATRFLYQLTVDVLTVGFGFLDHGVLPEMHGQNIVGVFAAPAGGPARLLRLVLRDHDTLRLHHAWAEAAGIPDPGYRIVPGGRQTLLLDRPEELVGYLQTLVVQVALRSAAVALCRHVGVPETAWWDTVGSAITEALDAAVPRPAVRAVLEDLMMAPTWPARAVLTPLLAAGPSAGVSMPAGVVMIPNPLRGGAAR